MEESLLEVLFFFSLIKKLDKIVLVQNTLCKSTQNYWLYI